MKIAVDIDNTLYDFETPVRDAFLCLGLATSDPSLFHGAYHPWTEWRSLGDSCGLDVAAQVIAMVHEDDIVLSREPFPGAVATLQALVAEGHELHYVTARAFACMDATSEWLHANGFPHGPLTCTLIDKSSVIGDCQILIDDRPRTLVEFVTDFGWKNKYGSEDVAHERKAFGLARPYNLNLTDIRQIYLAPTWLGLQHYLYEKELLHVRPYSTTAL